MANLKQSKQQNKKVTVSFAERTAALTNGPRASGKASGDEWRLGVWNARGLNDLKEKELRDTMRVRKIDILCVPETKKKGRQINKVENGLELWSGVDQDSHASQGIGLIMNERAKEHVKRYDCVSSRLLWVRMKVGIRRLFIVACYAPVDGDSKEAKDNF